jgi:hypothetical protein
MTNIRAFSTAISSVKEPWVKEPTNVARGAGVRAKWKDSAVCGIALQSLARTSSEWDSEAEDREKGGYLRDAA